MDYKAIEKETYIVWIDMMRFDRKDRWDNWISSG